MDEATSTQKREQQQAKAKEEERIVIKALTVINCNYYAFDPLRNCDVMIMRFSLEQKQQQKCSCLVALGKTLTKQPKKEIACCCGKPSIAMLLVVLWANSAYFNITE